MHRALRIPELLYAVFELLLADKCERSTASAATSCRTFFEPAMDVLWKDIDDITVLFKLWPPSALMRDNITKLNYRFDRDLQDGDWRRFDHYAYRVRSLTAHLGRPSLDGMDNLLHETFSKDLSKYLLSHGRVHLLPKLTKLELHGTLPGCNDVSQVLATPVLTSLAIHPLRTYMDLASCGIIKHIAELRPPLTAISWPLLRGRELAGTCGAVMFDFFPQSLEALSVHDSLFAIPVVARHLCSLPNLKRLCIGSDYYQPVKWYEPAFRPFKRIERLAAGRTNILRIVPHTPTIKHLTIFTLYDYETEIDEDANPSEEKFKELLDVVQRHCPDLEALEVQIDPEDPSQECMREPLQGMKLHWGSGDTKREIPLQITEPEYDMCRE